MNKLCKKCWMLAAFLVAGNQLFANVKDTFDLKVDRLQNVLNEEQQRQIIGFARKEYRGGQVVVAGNALVAGSSSQSLARSKNLAIQASKVLLKIGVRPENLIVQAFGHTLYSCSEADNSLKPKQDFIRIIFCLAPKPGEDYRAVNLEKIRVGEKLVSYMSMVGSKGKPRKVCIISLESEIIKQSDLPTARIVPFGSNSAPLTIDDYQGMFDLSGWHWRRDRAIQEEFRSQTISNLHLSTSYVIIRLEDSIVCPCKGVSFPYEIQFAPVLMGDDFECSTILPKKDSLGFYFSIPILGKAPENLNNYTTAKLSSRCRVMETIHVVVDSNLRVNEFYSTTKNQLAPEGWRAINTYEIEVVIFRDHLEESFLTFIGQDSKGKPLLIEKLRYSEFLEEVHAGQTIFLTEEMLWKMGKLKR